MRPIIKLRYLNVVICYLLFAIPNSVKAQITIGTPTLGFSAACASNDFNEFEATFVFSTADTSLLNSNIFTVHLSDADGDFNNEETIYSSSPGEFTTSPTTVKFSIPTDIAGENYRIRIKSTSPVGTSSRSVPFPAYFRLQNSPFTINNLVSTAAFCQGSSYILTIDNPGSNTNDSPLQFPSLTFNWFIETGPTTSAFVSSGETLEVFTEGTYFVETNYGSCTSNSFSNRVTVIEATSGGITTNIVSSLGNPFCPDQGSTRLTTIEGISYQWFVDGNPIDGATNQSYETDESGLYSVQIDLGGCTATAEFSLVSQLFDSNINVNNVNLIDDGDSLIATVTDTAISPTYQWFFNNTLIPNETSNTLEAFDFGSYRVVITETVGCMASVEYLFTIEEDIDLFPEVEDIPNIISPNGDGINDKWIIPTNFVSGTGTDVKIFSSQGELIFETNDYQNNWPVENLELNSVNAIYYYIISPQNGDEEKGSITVIK